MNKFVSERLNMPIAQGERIYTRWGYAPYFEDGSIQMIQPDIGNCGGITETKKVCDLAHIYDVGVQIHVCSSPLLTAASLHLESVIPNFTIHEHHVYNRYDYNRKCENMISSLLADIIHARICLELEMKSVIGHLKTHQ